MPQTEYAAPVSQGDDPSTVLRKIAYAAQNAGGGLTPSGVTPGSYTNTNLTVDENGIITAASNGFDPASPGPIGDVTPSTGAFTTLSSTPGDNATGLTITGGVITGAGVTPFLSITGEWNTTGTPAAILVDIVNTAGLIPKLLSLKTSGTEVFTVFGSGQVQTGSGSELVIGTSSSLRFASGGALSGSGNNLVIYGGFYGAIDLLQFGGTSASEPALKRSTTLIQARLANDSAFTVFQATLRTSANAVAETPPATHTIVIQDATGTAYKVLALAA